MIWKKENDIKKFLAINKQIENVRSKNNKNGWMFRLSLAVAPDQSIKIIKKIIARDKSITKFAEKLIK